MRFKPNFVFYVFDPYGDFNKTVDRIKQSAAHRWKRSKAHKTKTTIIGLIGGCIISAVMVVSFIFMTKRKS